MTDVIENQINDEKNLKKMKSQDLNANDLMCDKCFENLKNNNQIEDWNEIMDIINKYYLKTDPKKLLYNGSEDIELQDYKIELNTDIKGNLSMHGKCIIY